MPLVQTRGAASAQGFGEFAQASGPPVYIEDMFSCFLYTGTGATRTITNNIDLSTKGGLVWIKNRDTAGYSNLLIDTVRGAPNALVSNLTDPQTSATYGLTAFTTSGFTLGTAVASDIEYNALNKTFVSWTFREQPKFFDVVTYTGNGTAGRTVAHNLGSVPGCIIIKAFSGTGAGSEGWRVYHRSQGATKYAMLQSTNAFATASSVWNDTEPTSANFTVGTDTGANGSGLTFVAYIFAHDAGGFGLTGTDNVISCGSFTTDGSGNATVSLGYEPQFVLYKKASTTGQWYIEDTMRGLYGTSTQGTTLIANLSSAESAGNGSLQLTSTGFTVNPLGNLGTSTTSIYIAIRRGPMKVPTTGTSVFSPVTYSGNNSNNRVIDTTITPDLIIDMRRDNVMNKYFLDRLRGNGRLYSDLANAESSNTAQFPTNTFNVNQTGITVSADEVNASGRTFVIEAFRRAPSFFDEVCYTGTGVAGLTVAHNLTVVPELMIVKGRSIAEEWNVYFGNNTNYLKLNSNDVAQTATTRWNDTSPTSSVFSLGTSNWVNGSGSTYVAYLFATCAGVSKVGSYAGTGATQTINCGFGAGGARFVLIKRTDSTGDWYVWDSARGMISGTDPSLLLNSTAAEVNANSVYAISTGFQIVSTAAGINSSASGANYIFLAIA